MKLQTGFAVAGGGRRGCARSELRFCECIARVCQDTMGKMKGTIGRREEVHPMRRGHYRLHRRGPCRGGFRGRVGSMEGNRSGARDLRRMLSRRWKGSGGGFEGGRVVSGSVLAAVRRNLRSQKLHANPYA